MRFRCTRSNLLISKTYLGDIDVNFFALERPFAACSSDGGSFPGGIYPRLSIAEFFELWLSYN